MTSVLTAGDKSFENEQRKTSFDNWMEKTYKSRDQLKSLVPKSNKSTFDTSEKKLFVFFDGIYTHVYGKTKFRFKKCICVSYLDLNFTLLLALM